MKQRDRIAHLLPSPGGATLNASKLPGRITLLRRGHNETAHGTFIVNDRTAAGIAAQVAGGIYDRVLLDFQHNSEPDHPNYQPPPRHHAAVGVPFCDAEGLGMMSLEWTPKGIEHAGDYPDLSASIVFDHSTREVTALRSAALCAQGAAINGVAFFEADITPPPTPTQGKTMDPETIKTLEALTKRLAAVEEKLTKLESASSAAVTAADPANAAVNALTADALKQRKAAITDAAKRAGKVVSLNESAIAALSVEDLQAHVDALPGGRVPLKAQTAADGSAALTAAALITQYNTLTDPAERGAFFNAHRQAMGL